MKYIICVIILSLFVVHLPAQIYDPVFEDEWQEEEYHVRGERKSAATAIILSSIFPGSGHFYVNRRSFGTYVFPVIEIALWAGYIHFNKKGQDIERDYMKFADTHYDRARQNIAQTSLINHPQSSSIYNELHFRLDEKNTQHFYEDIGKYRKYIFGWEDWFNVFYHENQVDWIINDEGIWEGNNPTNPLFLDIDDPFYSPLRDEYIGMRRDAQDNFNRRDLITLGFALNRIASALDVVRVTTAYNRELRYASNFDFGLQPVFVNNKLTPMFRVSASF